MHIPIRPVRGRWPGWLEQVGPIRRFFRLDPLVIVDNDASPEDFREAMSSIYVGGTIKITDSNRHPEPDQLLMSAVDLSQAHIVDIGASDGSTSVDFIKHLSSFASYTIADLFLTLTTVRSGSRTLLFDNAGNCVLVVGKRAAAWPQLSRSVHAVYGPMIRSAAKRLAAGSDVLLLNPQTRALIEADDRVNYRVHDVFTPWTSSPVDVIKVANLLRRLYFSDEDLTRALDAIHDSLPEGGHLMIVDNPRLPNTSARAGVWRRDHVGFTAVAAYGDPEIADLVERVHHVGPPTEL